MLTVGVTSFILVQPGDEDATEAVAAALINEFHTFVVSHRELDFRDTQPTEIRNWFGDKVDFRVPLPVKSDDLRLAGGRLCNMFDQRIASFMYQVDDAWVSLYIMRSARSTQNSDDSHELLMKGYGFIDWEFQGLYYSLVGDLPVVRLRQQIGTGKTVDEDRCQTVGSHPGSTLSHQCTSRKNRSQRGLMNRNDLSSEVWIIHTLWRRFLIGTIP